MRKSQSQFLRIYALQCNSVILNIPPAPDSEEFQIFIFKFLAQGTTSYIMYDRERSTFPPIQQGSRSEL